ncbi:MAG TPA: hypothetical protein VFS43_42600 [Polyangiaceae bacterium]|nr:hypothetical protein [Polyangiaceae bacterium]
MKTRITLRLLCLGALGSLIVAGSNCADQREPECTSPAAGHFTVRLEPTDVPAGCENEVLRGIVVATRSYYVLDAEGNVDYDQPFRVAIQTLEMGEQFIGLEGQEEFDIGGDESVNRLVGGVSAASLIETNKLYAYGQFTTPQPDSNDQCYIPTTTPAVLESPGLLAATVTTEDDPETEEDEAAQEFVPPEDASTYRAEWSNVTFLVSTAYPGVQFTGTLVYTRPVFQDVTEPAPTAEDPMAVRVIRRERVRECAITYTGVAVSAVNTYDCSTPLPSDEDAPPYAREEGYNQALCGAEPDFSQGIAVGAGINPDFPIVCDPETKLCLLDGPFRSGATNL